MLVAGWRFLIGAALISSIAACSRSGRAPAQVESLRSNLPDLQEVAENWRADAYLSSADLPLTNGGVAPWLIAAGFQSPTESAESLLVMLEHDGSITTKRMPHTVPLIQTEPIRERDWELDSAEALDSALDSTGLRFLEDYSDHHCSFLDLERAFDLPGRPVVWWLRLTECFGGGDFDQVTVIDPISGEVLERK